jgi:hypothetical protein
VAPSALVMITMRMPYERASFIMAMPIGPGMK